MRDSELSRLIYENRADLRRVWRTAAHFDDVAEMHITNRGEPTLEVLASSMESDSPDQFRRMLSRPPWTGNDRGADSPGALLVSLDQALKEFTKGDDDAVARLIGSLAGGLDSVMRERMRALEERAATDALTGVMSRAAILDQLRAESARVVRHGGQLGVVYMDVVGLKRTNDEQGHAAGDELLRRMAELVTRNTRAADRLGRLGGDEFLLVLPETDIAGAKFVADKVTGLLAETGVNVTCGAAGTPDASPNAHELVTTADAAMRAARSNRT